MKLLYIRNDTTHNFVYIIIYALFRGAVAFVY